MCNALRASPPPPSPQEEEEGNCQTLFRAAAIGYASSVVCHVEEPMPCDPNQSNVQGHTALFLAIDHNQPMTVYTLLRLGANPKLMNRNGFMAIHQAAYQGDPETLVILLHHDANSLALRARDSSQPLHLAAARGHVLCVQILLSCGADVTTLDGDGKTALALAEEHKMSGESLTVAPLPRVAQAPAAGKAEMKVSAPQPFYTDRCGVAPSYTRA